jgi:hypothetical protein
MLVTKRIPIDCIPDTVPPRFRWNQMVSTPGGQQVVEQEGTLPPSVEVAVAELVSFAKRLMRENAGLQGQVQGLADRVAAQSELLGKKAEKSGPITAQPSEEGPVVGTIKPAVGISSKRGRGT